MNKGHLLFTCFVFCGQVCYAEQTPPPRNSSEALPVSSAITQAHGLLMLDYESINQANGESFDLFGVHYLYQLNDWLYWGGGLSAPMLEGNYGGFFALDTTVHVQRKVYGNFLVDAGLAVGAAAGGASVSNIPTVSGTGPYFKGYVGIGYEAGGLRFGVNYSRIKKSDSILDGSTVNFFFQKSLSFPIGSYADAGKSMSQSALGYQKNDSIISFGYSNLSQIDPKGRYRGDIGLVSPQFSRFFDDRDYVFFNLDLGYSGLIWYNQALGGFGREIPITRNINLYGQIGIGSGGWVTDTIDTGPGLVLYPKVKLEYLWGNGIGAFLSAGYLWAPKGTSRNWSFGAGIDYHLAPVNQAGTRNEVEHDFMLRGVRFNLFERTAFDVHFNDWKVNNLNLMAMQIDYGLRDNWYLPFQVAAALNNYNGYAGYVEGLAGLGWQSNFGTKRIHSFAQLMYGMNDIGINSRSDVGALLNGAIGVNFDLNDRYSIYGQIGKTISLGRFFRRNFTNSFQDYFVGLGVTYRFSLPIGISK